MEIPNEEDKLIIRSKEQTEHLYTLYKTGVLSREQYENEIEESIVGGNY